MNKKLILVCFILMNFSFSTKASNIEKPEDIVSIVKEAVDFLATNSIAAACQKFTQNMHPSKRKMFIFMLNHDGDILCFGDHAEHIWQNISSAKNSEGKVFKSTNSISVIENIYSSAKQDNWVEFFWNNIRQKAYVKEVSKDGSNYIIGGGFYPNCHEYERIKQRSMLISNRPKNILPA